MKVRLNWSRKPKPALGRGAVAVAVRHLETTYRDGDPTGVDDSLSLGKAQFASNASNESRRSFLRVTSLAAAGAVGGSALQLVGPSPSSASDIPISIASLTGE